MKKIKLLLILIIFLGFFKTAYAASVENLITVGTGSNKITITNKTKISEIENVLGTAKIKTSSPYGGYAYTFYTDNNYSNHLYIETDENNDIIFYGSVSPTYNTYDGYTTYGITRSDNYNRDYTVTYNNKNVGVMLINNSAYYANKQYSFDNIAKKMAENYPKNPTEYQKGFSKHAYAMLEGIIKAQNINKQLLFSDELLNYQLSGYQYGYSFSSIIYRLFTYDTYSGAFSDNKKELTAYRIDYFNSTLIINPLMFVERVLREINKVNNNDYIVFEYTHFAGDKYRMVKATTIDETLKKVITSGEIENYLGLSPNEIKFSKKEFQAFTMNNSGGNEYDKISAISQYIQNGTWYNLNARNQNIKELFSQNHGVCAAYADSAETLANDLGMNCYEINSSSSDHAVDLCNLEGNWSYIDMTKARNTNKPTSYIGYNVRGLRSKTQFASGEFKNFFKNIRSSYFTFDEYPEGANKSEELKSNIFFDDTYKYYTAIVDANTDNQCKSSGNKECTYIFRENLTSGKKDKLTNLNTPVSSFTEVFTFIMDDNDIFYMGEDRKLYTMNKDGSNLKVKVNDKISGLYMQDGVIYYVNSNEKGVKLKDATTWPEVGEYQISENAKLLYLKNKNGVGILEVKGINGKLPYMSGNVTIPDTIDGKPVIMIMDSAFGNVSGDIDTLKLPTNLISIASYGFYNVNIKHIEFNNKLKSIGTGAFQLNKTLEELTIPNNVEFIGSRAFSDNEKLKKVKIGNGIKLLNDHVFALSAIENFELPEGIEYISRYAMPAKSFAKEFVIPSTVKYLDLYITPTGMLTSYSDNKNLERIIIKAKNLEYFNADNIVENYKNVKLFLHGNSKTGALARSQNIEFIDLDNLGQTLTLSNNSLEVGYYDEPVKLTYKVEPLYFNDITASWSSSNKNVVTVDNNGQLKYIEPGEATITLTLSNGLKANCNVTVKPSDSSNLLIDKPYLKLSVGDTYQYKPLVLLENGSTSNNITWISSDNSIATISNSGLLTAHKNGEVTITIKSNGMTKLSHVTVSNEYLIDTIKSAEYIKQSVVFPSDYNATTNKNNNVLVNYNISNTSLFDENMQVLQDKGGFVILEGTDTTYGYSRCMIHVLGGINTSSASNLMFGDLNNDYVIDNLDVIKLANILKEDSTNEDYIKLADFDNNGSLDTNDLDLIYEVATSNYQIKDSNITINMPSQTIYLNDSLFISNYIANKNTSTALAKWSVSDENILKLYNNTGERVHIKVQKLGTATLSVTGYDGKTYSQTITVKEPTYELSTDNLIVELGKTKTVSLLTKASSVSTTHDITNNNIKIKSVYESENEEYVNGSFQTTSISQDFVVEGLNIGTTYLIIKPNETREYRVKVDVIAPEDEYKSIKSLSITGNNTITKNSSTKLNVAINPSDATNDNDLEWTSSNNSIAQVSEDGIINGISAGTATITVTSSNGITASHNITINEIAITSLTLKNTTETIMIGEEKTLDTTINPTNTTMDHMLLYTSSNPDIVTVNEGIIKGINTGEAKITISSVNGKEITCNVTVKKPDYLKGDLNKNGKIDLPDVINLLKLYLGINDITSETLQIGDMDNNSKIELNDIILLLKIYLGIN